MTGWDVGIGSTGKEVLYNVEVSTEAGSTERRQFDFTPNCVEGG